MSLKAKIESVLFLTEKPVRAAAIARIVNEDVQLVRQAILELINDYETRDGALEIADDDGYIIQVKDQYSSIIDEFLPMELPLALLRTLSAIAIKQPVAQADIIKIRGAGAYDHIKELLARELINKKEDGRSPLLTTTKQFQDYFRLTQDAKSLRTELRKTDRKKTQDDETSTFDASPENDTESNRLVVQLTLDGEAGEALATAEKISVERELADDVAEDVADAAADDAAADDSESNAINRETPAVTIAPAALDAALESMSDGSGDAG